MIVLTGPTQIPVAPPAQVNSLDYQAELASIKAAQGASPTISAASLTIGKAAACCDGTS
jgi:hypothetical protein